MTAGSRVQWLWLAVIVGVGLALRWSVIDAGLHMDDYAQLAMLAGDYPVERASWDLFSFTRGAGENHLLMSRGSLPWWSDPQLELSALRPVASLLGWVDVYWLGDDATTMHLHSMAWWVVAMSTAFVALRRHASPTVALVALSLYALDDAHAYPLAWIANRAALVSATFGFLALWAHARWREEQWSPGAVVAVVAIAIAVAAGEYGLCAAAFVLGYEVRGPGSVAARLRAAVPTVVVVGIYLALHRVGGFGSEHSGVYLDPAREPVAFATALLERFPVLLADILLAVPLSQTLGHPAVSQHPGWLAAAVLLPVLAGLLWTRRGQSEVDRRRLDGWAVGGALALVPVCASFLSGRLTVVAALAGHLWVAVWIVHGIACLRRGPRPRGAWLAGGLAAVLAVSHLVAAPIWGRLELGGIAAFNRAGVWAARRFEPGPSPIPFEQRRVIALTVTDPMMLIYPPWIRRRDGKPLPRSWWALSMAPHVHRMTRSAADTLELEVVDGAMLRGPVEILFRDVPRRPRVGEHIELDGLSIEILAVAADGAPTRVRYRFDRSLEDPSLCFVIISPRGILRYPIGPVGSTVTVAPGAHPLTFEVNED